MRKKMKNKKGVSAVIATLLLVVITIIATLMVWQFVKKQIIDKNIEESSCFEYRDYVRISDSVNTCYNDTNTKIQIERSLEDKNIDGIALTISSGDTQKSYQLKNNTQVDGVTMNSGSKTIILPVAGEAKTYVFNIPKGNLASITVIINGKACDQIRQSSNIDPC